MVRNYSLQTHLKEEDGEKVEERADEMGVPPAVFARMAIKEKLRDMEENGYG